MSRSHTEQAPNRTPLWWAMRVVWGGLATMHVWPFAVLVYRLFTAPSAVDAFWLASLVGVVGLFGLKAIDSARLRLHRPGIEFTAFVIVAAMIHGDVIMPESLPALAVETATVAVVAAGGVMIASRRLRRRFSEFLRGLARLLRSVGPVRRLVAFVPVAAWDCPERVVRCCAPARAPPC